MLFLLIKTAGGQMRDRNETLIPARLLSDLLRCQQAVNERCR